MHKNRKINITDKVAYLKIMLYIRNVKPANHPLKTDDYGSDNGMQHKE